MSIVEYRLTCIDVPIFLLIIDKSFKCGVLVKTLLFGGNDAV